MTDETQLHWLVRPSTIRKLWIGTSIVLALVVLAQTVIYVKGYFGFDAWFGFGAVYGFVSCLIMVLVAKLLGFLLKRPEDYYDETSQSISDKAMPQQAPSHKTTPEEAIPDLKINDGEEPNHGV